MELSRLVKKALTVHWRELWPLLNQMHKESGRSRVDLLRDMVDCYRKNGHTWENYATYGFHLNTEPDIRATFFSQGEMDKILPLIHTPNAYRILADKGETLRYFKPFIKRAFVDLRRDDYASYEAFLEKIPVFFVKPPLDCGGKGVERMLSDKIEDRRALYEKLMAEGRILLEEAVRQHPEMNKLSIHSINTIRIGTCVNAQGEYSTPYMGLRLSFSDAWCDNTSQGGGVTLLSDEGRIVAAPATNLPTVRRFEKHPTTGFSYVGFQVPMIEEVKKLVVAAAKTLPESRYIGWDVAVCVDGPEIIEANDNPSPELFQEYKQVPNGRGLKAKMEEALGMKL